MREWAHKSLAGGAAALAVAAMGIVLLAGCGGGEPARQSSPAVIKVTPTAASGVTVHARVGDTVVVSLAANPTTGYQWQFAPGDTFSIESSAYVADPNPGNLAGKGGTQIVTLKVTRAGTSDLTGRYVRPWETPSPSPAARVRVTISGS
jgi:inhibitor of cysteine peptidase